MVLNLFIHGLFINISKCEVIITSGLLFNFDRITIYLFWFQKHKKTNTIKYAITQDRVFFRQFIGQETQINSILIEYIPRVYLNNYDHHSKKGDISFLLKKPAKGKFITYRFDNNQPHELPTFQQVENAKEIMQIIQQQIRKHHS